MMLDGNSAALAANMRQVDADDAVANTVEAYLHDEADDHMTAGDPLFAEWLGENPEQVLTLAVAACGFPLSPGLTPDERREVRRAKVAAAAARIREDYRAHVVAGAEYDGRYDELMADAKRGEL